MKMANRLAKDQGGGRETRVPVAGFVTFAPDVQNVIVAVDSEGEPLFQIGYRPFEEQYAKTGGLFICG
jgi:hypothetical protein